MKLILQPTNLKIVDGLETAYIGESAHAIINDAALYRMEVLQAGTPRTGTTIVWRILSQLFQLAWKTHHHLVPSSSSDLKVFMTYRNPLDVVVSRWRVECGLEEDQIKANEVALWHEHGLQTQLIEAYQKTYGKENVILLQYEKIVDNYDIIFNAIEEACGISIFPGDRHRLATMVSRKNAIAIQNSMPTQIFSERFDHASGIHPSHVYVGDKKSWREFVPELHQEELVSLLSEELTKLGYEGD